ncbi:unnamed protein product [Onchocerca ochengi]|uniref:Ovule protein n=1 Tax=Onchocerca ochengi TaxID=42157 RepID=A0A182ELF4_ONCOC|nr:unnamed protein product [Onchocerca ochengi]
MSCPLSKELPMATISLIHINPFCMINVYLRPYQERSYKSETFWTAASVQEQITSSGGSNLGLLSSVQQG